MPPGMESAKGEPSKVALSAGSKHANASGTKGGTMDTAELPGVGRTVV